MLRISGWIIGAFLAMFVAVPRTASAETANISVLYTADTHGRLRSFYYDEAKPIGGISKRAIFFHEKRRHKSMGWLTLDSGDALSGTALADVFEGYLCIQAMNMLKYDAMTLGVHDFDFGMDVLKQRMSEAEFAVLSANIKYLDTGQPFATPYVILERQGTRIAIFGLTTGELANRVAPTNFTGLQVLEPIETARLLVAQLAGQADVIIALTHLGINEDIRLASEVPGIDVIVGGMSHSELQVPMKFEDTLIVHSAEYGRNVGLLKLSFDPQQNYRQVYFANTLEPIAGKWVANSDFEAWLDSYNEPLRQRMEVIVGSSALEMSSAKIRSAETPLGNYVTDIMRDKLRADVALLPAAFFPGSLPEGPITLGDLYSALPYDHYGVVMEVTGGELKEILDNAADQLGKPGFPQVSGVSFGILGGQAYSVLVGGQELDLFANYRLATSDIMADGNYGYSRLGTISRVFNSGLMIRDIVRERLASGQIAQASVYQRIQFHAYDSTLYAGTPPADSTEIVGGETTPPAVETGPTQPPETETPAYESVPETYVPPETTSPPVDTTPPADSLERDTGTSEDYFPATESTDDTEPAANDATADDQPGLDSLRYDRTGQPLGQPVVVEDIALEDTGSGIEPTSTTPEVAPPATGVPETSPSAAGTGLRPEDLTDTIEDGSSPDTGEERPIGVARGSSAGLGYLFTLVKATEGYEYRLQISNTTMQPIELNYATGAKFDFIVRSGTDLLWSYNWNRFFTQSPESQTLAPGEVIMFRGEWDGLAKDGSILPATSLRFESIHQLAGDPVSLQFDALLPR